MFSYYSENHIQIELKKNWWSYLLFVHNIYPPSDDLGLYWLFFVANEIQFYILVMMPSIYFYQKRNWRNFVLYYLTMIIIGSMLYLTLMTYNREFSTLLTLEEPGLFDALFRHPFGPAGYYAMGICFSIFYFEI